ncbi:MFS transporter [Aeromicrobium sp. PE09-221]|uniref:MFS transporter n=1 Tax=Aeromicrobium sp. PE09-221 TaxID=1898043 RepID=UPI000B3E7B81|nr:MFS transporter [Aeromicrobium sp. PE09-221]OUZ06763.1 MFS transporter [Aeromicrobium sp. PE09-221]
MTVQTSAAPALDHRRSLVAVTFGNVLEWYEWSAYAAFTPFIALAMFDSTDKVSAVLSAFAVFAVGFLMRPLGGIVFGRIADRSGRRRVLVVTLLMMGAGSFAIALTPSFETIGVGASLILLLARLVQGFAHGGESAASYSYVAELAPPERRGLWGSSVYGAVLGGIVLATIIAVILLLTVGEDAVQAWAWRVPFFIGGLLALVVLFLRRRMPESEVFSAKLAATDQPEQLSVKGHTRAIVLGVMLVCGLTVVQYTWVSFVGTHAMVANGMPAKGGYLAILGAQIVCLITLPFWGRLSDRIGRRPIFIGFAAAVAVLHVPLMSLVDDDPLMLFVACAVALTAATAVGALQAATLAELFPTGLRTLGIGVAVAVSVAVFGGTAPYLNEWLFSRDLEWAAHLYVVGAAIATGVAAWLMPETKGISLHSITTLPGAASRRGATSTSITGTELSR